MNVLKRILPQKRESHDVKLPCVNEYTFLPAALGQGKINDPDEKIIPIQNTDCWIQHLKKSLKSYQKPDFFL